MAYKPNKRIGDLPAMPNPPDNYLLYVGSPGNQLYNCPKGSLGFVPSALLGQPNGIATLDASGKVYISQMPAVAITNTFVVNSEAEMLALSAQVGDVAVRPDIDQSFILATEPATEIANWVGLVAPTAVGGGGIYGGSGTLPAAVSVNMNGNNLSFIHNDVPMFALNPAEEGGQTISLVATGNDGMNTELRLNNSSQIGFNLTANSASGMVGIYGDTYEQQMFYYAAKHTFFGIGQFSGNVRIEQLADASKPFLTVDSDGVIIKADNYGGIYAGSGYLTSDINVTLNGNDFNMKDGSRNMFFISPITNNKYVFLNAENGSQIHSRLELNAGNGFTFRLESVNQNTGVFIVGNSENETIDYVASNQHNFIGPIILQTYAGNGDGFLAINDGGQVYWSAGAAVLSSSKIIDDPAFNWDTENKRLLIGGGNTANQLFLNQASGQMTNAGLVLAAGNTGKVYFSANNMESQLYTINHNYKIWVNGTGNLAIDVAGPIGVTYNVSNKLGKHTFQTQLVTRAFIDNNGMTIVGDLKVTGRIIQENT